MKEILADLGCLLAVKKVSSELLTESIGTTRQNLISALKGRRHLPVAHLPSLRQVIGLDDSYRFVPNRVHGLTVNPGENPTEFVQSFQGMLRRFMVWPVRSKWLLRGIGEGSRSGFAYVFEDSRAALVAVRNDDALLGTSVDAGNQILSVENDGGHASAGCGEKNTGNVALRPGNEHMSVDMSIAVDMESLFSRTDGSPEREVTLRPSTPCFRMPLARARV